MWPSGPETKRHMDLYVCIKGQLCNSGMFVAWAHAEREKAPSQRSVYAMTLTTMLALIPNKSRLPWMKTGRWQHGSACSCVFSFLLAPDLIMDLHKEVDIK